MYTTCNLNTII